ncbi:MAG: hypothetical protein IJJ41_10120 [Clostridia bacterium]|nr:hypothetical protein [Clostridia bacterium]
MPTFKADYVEYDPQRSERDNLLELFTRHNDLIERVSHTVNHLDEENWSVPAGQEGESEDE